MIYYGIYAFIDTMELISSYQKRGHYSRPNTIFTDRLFPRYHVVIKFYVEMWCKHRYHAYGNKVFNMVQS